jgi:aspartate-semialdehyde dehydrogenase
MTIDACCNRVPVIDGHTECLAIKFHRPPPSIEAVKSVLESYVSDAQKLGVVTAPERAIVVATDNDRPQPRLDVMQGRGYSVTVGRLRKGNYWDIQFTILSHNTILGAAGSSIMNAEIAMKKGLLGGAE